MQSDRISDALLPVAGSAGAKLGQALLWQPSFVRDDNMLWHVPFLFWLVETTQPKLYVEIGVGEGVGYMTVCQALHKMRANSRCYAVGEWKNDDGEKWDPPSFAARNADLYGEFSRILRGGVDQAADSIENGSVDLMLVDLTAAPTVAASLHRRWIPKLAEKGILLVNGVDGSDDATAVLVDALSANSATVRLPGGDGLLVVLPSRKIGDEFSRLVALAPEDPAQKLIIDMFTRLGAATYFEANVKDKDRRVQALEEKTKELWRQREKLGGELRELREQYESRHRRAAMLESREFDFEQAIAAAEAERGQVRSELSRLRAEQEEAQSLLEWERGEAEQKLQQGAAEAQQRSLRIDELEKRCLEEAKHHERLTREITETRGRVSQLQEQLKIEYASRAEAEYAAQEAAKRAVREITEARGRVSQLREQLKIEYASRAEAEYAAQESAKGADREIAEARGRVSQLQEQLKIEYASRAEAEYAGQEAAKRADREITEARGRVSQLQEQLKIEYASRAEAEYAAQESAKRADREMHARLAAEGEREAARAALDREKKARAESELQHRHSIKLLKEEERARSAAEAQHRDAVELLDRDKAARIDADQERAEATAEGEVLRRRLTELMLDVQINQKAVRSLVETAEESENIIAALSEELRMVREQIRACLLGPDQPPHEVGLDGTSS